MKKFNLKKMFRNPKTVAAASICLSLLLVMCHRQEQQAKRNELNNKISVANQTVYETRDLRTANVPQNLKSTQIRYKQASDSLNRNAEFLEICQNQNDSLVARAFNNYAMRIGRDFQMSAFLPEKDIAIFQKHIAAFDSMDFIQENARRRILQNEGSMHDLMYFIELIDFDSVNNQLENKLTWNFYTDSTDAEPVEMSVLCFEKQSLNDVLGTEMRLLDRAWQSANLHKELNATDSLYARNIENVTDSVQRAKLTAERDSAQSQIMLEYFGIDEYEPNFAIPEFDSIRAQYMHNDSLINGYKNTFNNMIRAEDTLELYRQKVIRKRDSLVEELNTLER